MPDRVTNTIQLLNGCTYRRRPAVCRVATEFVTASGATAVMIRVAGQARQTAK